MTEYSQWHRERVALELWRDAFVAYLDSAPDYSKDFPKKVKDATASAALALEAACCDVAAQNDVGVMEHGLSHVLTVVRRQEFKKAQRSKHAVDERVIVGDDRELSRTRFWVLVDTVDRAIEYLKDQESRSSL